jgi:hypothetical protein
VLSDCRRRGAVDEAIEVATRALAVEGDHFMALQTLAWAYVTRGDHAAAGVIVAKALEQFRARGLGPPSKALRVIEALRRLIHPDRRSVVEALETSMKDWARWAESYLEWQQAGARDIGEPGEPAPH